MLDFEKRLPTLLRGTVVTCGPEALLRLGEEVKLFSVRREGARELTSPLEAARVFEELVAPLLLEVLPPVDVTCRAPAGVPFPFAAAALELAAERPATVEVRALEKLQTRGR